MVKQLVILGQCVEKPRLYSGEWSPSGSPKVKTRGAAGEQAHRHGKLEEEKKVTEVKLKSFNWPTLFGDTYIIGTAGSVGHYLLLCSTGNNK